MQKFLYGSIIAIVGALPLQQALGRDVVEFEMESRTDSIMPILIDNDPNLVAVFRYESDAIFNGGKIGTFSLQELLTDPPLDLGCEEPRALLNSTIIRRNPDTQSDLAVRCPHVGPAAMVCLAT